LSAHLVPSPSTAIVVANVQQHYAAVPELAAVFRRSITNAHGITSTEEGTVQMSAAGAFRWDYLRTRRGHARVSHVSLFDGQTLWRIDHDAKTLTGSVALPLDPESLSLMFLTQNTSYAASFRVTTWTPLALDEDIVLELSPAQPSTTSPKVYFVVAPSNFRVRESWVVHPTGVTERIQFFAQAPPGVTKASLYQVNPSGFPRYRVTRPPQSSPLNTRSSAPTGSASSTPPSP
jgi:outer membrane lipoprotein-sorting protein